MLSKAAPSTSFAVLHSVHHATATPLNPTTNLNTTLACHSLNRNKAACSDLPGKDIGDLELCHCYNKGPQLSHNLISTGLTNACRNHLAMWPLGPHTGHPYTYAYTDIWYGPDSYHIQTFFLLKVEYVGENLPQCTKALDVGGWLGIGLNMALDGCNTEGVIEKQGGWSNDACWAFTVDTDPYENNAVLAQKIAPST